MLGMIVAFFPRPGSLDWFNILFSAARLVVSLIALCRNGLWYNLGCN